MKNIIPYLWFDNQAGDAAEFYTQVFPDSRILSTSRFREANAAVAGQTAGSVMSVSFTLSGLEMVALNGGPYYSFTPAISFFVHCRDNEEFDRIWDKLFTDGQILMERGQYPFSEQYGWLIDRFGVSWQIMLSAEPVKIVPSLLFTNPRYGQAEPAINLYTATIPESGVRLIERQPDGKVLYASFTLHGQLFTAMESDLDHKFTFTPAISFLLNCDSQAEVDQLWDELTAGGVIEQCGWIQDRFGVSWQIVPGELFDLIQDEDPVKAERAMLAMLQMKKIDLEKLRQAHRG